MSASENFDVTEYARLSAGHVVDYLSRMTGGPNPGAAIAAQSKEAWLELVVVEVSRDLTVKWQWETVAGYACVGEEHRHVTSEDAWERDVEQTVEKLKGGRISSSALENLGHKAPFPLSLQGARVYEPAERLAFHHACLGCAGTGKAPCKPCNGTGRVRCRRCKGKTPDLRLRLGNAVAPACTRCASTGMEPCRTCAGSSAGSCPTCRGTGKVTRVTRFTVAANETRRILPQSVSDARLGIIASACLADGALLPDFAREERLHEASSSGKHTQRFTLAIPVCRVDLAFGGVASTVCVAGYVHRVFFANTHLDPVVGAALEMTKSVHERCRWWSARDIRTAKAVYGLSQKLPILQEALRLVRNPKGRTTPDCAEVAQVLEMVESLARRLGYGLSEGTLRDYLMTLRRYRKPALASRWLTSVSAAVAFGWAGVLLFGQHLWGFPLSVVPFLAVWGALSHPVLWSRWREPF